MATSTYTEDFGVSSLNEFINGLKHIREVYRDEEEAANAAAWIMEWFGWIGVPGYMVVPAALLAGALAVYFDILQDTVTSAIEQAEYWKDFLQDNSSRYDLVRMRVTVQEEKMTGTTYLIPIKFETLAVHSKNPPGWVTV